MSYNDTVIRLVMPPSIGSLNVSVYAFNQGSAVGGAVRIDPPVLTMGARRLLFNTDGGDSLQLQVGVLGACTWVRGRQACEPFVWWTAWLFPAAGAVSRCRARPCA
jgi:hypothetical protein